MKKVINTLMILLVLAVVISMTSAVLSIDDPEADLPPAESIPGEPANPPSEVTPDEPETPPEKPVGSGQFTDVPPGKFYTKAVDWAVKEGVTAGITDTTFCPNAHCTRAQAVTFLWRAAGKPAPKSLINPFRDVDRKAYYYKAVLWAVENGVTNGTSADRFSPSADCSRAQIVTFLWRAAGMPREGSANFSDVGKHSYFAPAVRWAVKNGVTNGLSENIFGPERHCSRGHIVTFLYRAKDLKIAPKLTPFSQEFSLYYGDTALDSKAGCAVNRPYVSVRLLRDRFGLDPVAAASQLRWPLHYGEDGDYIALADAVKLCKIGVMFRDTDSSVHLYDLADLNWSPSTPAPNAKKAYIRLEDITADFGISGRFTHENLNKLRFFGAYLRDHTDAFYIAWIPLYTNPGKQIQNDISKDESFYNADFVFTLDCLVDDGGRIGLHGLTHQHADEISADGYEFGDNIPYTKEELLARFQQAEDICSSLGYTWHFFEFPHYAASDYQKQLTEERYDVIYQQYTGADPIGHIVARTTGDHTCLWVPTPADYVHSQYDSDGIADRLTAAHDAGKEISLYFHPSMDNRNMKTKLEGNVMTFTYDEGSGILARVIRMTDGWGYRFSTIR